MLKNGAWSVALGLVLALLGLFLEAFFRLAYQQEALSEPSRVVPVLLLFQWPALLAAELGVIPHGLTDFGHSHSQGRSFWLAAQASIFLNGLGWAIVILVCLSLFRRNADTVP